MGARPGAPGGCLHPPLPLLSSVSLLLRTERWQTYKYLFLMDFHELYQAADKITCLADDWRR